MMAGQEERQQPLPPWELGEVYRMLQPMSAIGRGLDPPDEPFVLVKLSPDLYEYYYVCTVVGSVSGVCAKYPLTPDTMRVAVEHLDAAGKWRRLW